MRQRFDRPEKDIQVSLMFNTGIIGTSNNNNFP